MMIKMIQIKNCNKSDQQYSKAKDIFIKFKMNIVYNSVFQVIL
jgi:hypothetical protein